MNVYETAAFHEHQERKRQRAIIVDLLRRALHGVFDNFPIEIPETDPIHKTSSRPGSQEYAHEMFAAYRKAIYDNLIYYGYELPKDIHDKLLEDKLFTNDEHNYPMLFDEDLESAMQELLDLLEGQEEGARTLQGEIAKTAESLLP